MIMANVLNGKRAKFRIRVTGSKSSILLGNYKANDAKARASELAETTPGIILLYLKSPGLEEPLSFNDIPKRRR